MPAPSNQTPATAVDLGVLPIFPATALSVSQDVNFSGTTYTVWYSHLANVDDNEVVSMFAYGDPTSYIVNLTVYEGLANANSNTKYLDGFQNSNAPAQIPVTSGLTYYFKFESNNGNVVDPAILSLTVLAAPSILAPAGSVLVNDHAFFDTNVEPFPVVMYGQTDGAILQFRWPFAAGNAADVLDNGISLWESTPLSPAAFRLYDAQFNILATVTNPLLHANLATQISTNKVDRFYVGNAGSGADHARATTISDAGVAGPTTWVFGALGLTTLAPSNDDTILYYAGQTSSVNAAVKQWDLIGNVAMADLVAGVANYRTDHILVLDDGTLIVSYKRAGVDSYIKHYSAAGATLNTYAFGDGTTVPETGPLARAIDDPNSFWVWTFISNVTFPATSRFQNIKVSDGSVLNTFDEVQFEEGVNENINGGTPAAPFGNSDSCPFLIARQDVTPLNPLPPAVGTIEVIKIATPDDGTEFPFEATGLDPGSFTLTNGCTQTFEDVTPGSGYGIVERVPDGWAQSSIVVSNDSDPTNITVEADETVTVTVTNVRSYHVIERIIRRLRRAPHITQNNKRIFVNQFELILQPGVGVLVDPGIDPQVMLRVSYDAGKTWEPEQQMSAGELGNYRKRVVARQLGQARDLVFEVTVSDPVAWYLTEAFLEIEQGLT